MVCIDSFRLQTMTALIKSFYWGVQGGRFFQKESPLVAEGSHRTIVQRRSRGNFPFF
jgi:hypothetical protein